MDKGDLLGLFFIAAFFFVLYIIVKYNTEE